MKKSTFRKVLLIYVAVFAVVIAVIGIVVWNKLENYQKSYDKAKAAGSPEIFIKEMVSDWDVESVGSYIAQYGVSNLGEFNNNEALAEIFAGQGTEITYVKGENYTEVMPIYDIYAGNTRAAVVSLKPLGSNDDFGFHKWQIRNLVFDTNNLETINYKIKVTSDCEVVVNGTTLTAENISQSYIRDDVMSAWIGQKYGFTTEYVEYNLGACVKLPEITVTNGSNEAVTEYEVNGDVVEYNCTSDETFRMAVETRVLDTVHAYISNIYYKLTFYQLSQYLVKNSDAYVIIKDVQDGIIWGWHPDVVEIIEESVSEYVKYSDTLFSCKYYAKIYKADEDEEYEEIFNYQLLFEQVDGEYYLTYFNLD